MNYMSLVIHIPHLVNVPDNLRPNNNYYFCEHIDMYSFLLSIAHAMNAILFFLLVKLYPLSKQWRLFFHLLHIKYTKYSIIIKTLSDYPDKQQKLLHIDISYHKS